MGVRWCLIERVIMMLRMKGLVVGTKGGGETVVIGTGYQESLQGAKGQVARGLPEAKGAQGAQEALVLTRVALVEHQERSNNISSSRGRVEVDLHPMFLHLMMF